MCIFRRVPPLNLRLNVRSRILNPQCESDYTYRVRRKKEKKAVGRPCMTHIATYTLNEFTRNLPVASLSSRTRYCVVAVTA